MMRYLGRLGRGARRSADRQNQNQGIEHLIRKPVRPNPDCRGLYHLVEPLELRGISERYLGSAEDEFARFVNYEYPFWAIKREIDRAGINLDGAMVIDLASGFGNTVIPMLNKYATCKVLASDLSEQMLRILLREARSSGVAERVLAVECDAQNDIWQPACADLVVGGAALHHMIDPSLTIITAANALVPGGSAIFLEPMEAGNAIMRLAFEEILRLPQLEDDRYQKAADFLRIISKDIDARTHHSTRSKDYCWAQLDDKWLFPHSYLFSIAQRCDCVLTIHALHSSERVFTTAASNSLTQYGNLACPDCLPKEGWLILERYDSSFSNEALADLPLEAALVFTKRC